MDAKISLQQLAVSLAHKTDMPRKEAEAFLREFFEAIVRGVEAEKSVKVKGLGTFRLVQMPDRESVSIHTGERIVIPGHQRLSFTPDVSLANMVNKPFSDFQAVVINEGTSLEEMERLPSDPLVNEEEEPETVPDAGREADLETGQEADAKAEEAAETTAEPSPQRVSDFETEARQEPPEEAAGEEVVPPPATVQQPVKPEAESAGNAKSAAETVKVRAMTTAEKCALTLGVALLCFLSYLAGGSHLFGSHNDVVRKDKPKKVETVSAPRKAAAKAVGQKKDTLPAVPASKPDTVSKALPLRLDPDRAYRITGTRRTYVLKPGDYLTRIAMEEYGSKDFARYIIAHNRFANPDNIPVGAEVKLPDLEPAE